MKELAATWNRLELKGQVTLALATVGVFLAILLTARVATTPTMSLLYSGLDPSAAGEVTAALDTRGVTYDVRGTSIFVDQSARDRLRLDLASEGLPANSNEGFEILERMTGFGTTSKMFDAAYWRAKEGELARTIAAARNIQSARVHIGKNVSTQFGRDEKSSASVTLVTNGSQPSGAQARSIQFLVASAVANLQPANVSIIDANTGQMISTDSAGRGGVEASAREAILRQNVERLLTARLGPNRSVVEVTVETVTAEETIVERKIDPGSRVVISTDTQERSSEADGQGNTGVSVASNLPEGDAGGTNSQSSRDNETRERINYDLSQTERELRLAPGSVKRITVAVLVDGERVLGEDGVESWTPRSAEELQALEGLVQAAVGFDDTRGDRITVESLKFDRIDANEGSAPTESSLISQFDLNSLAKIVLILIGAFVLLRLVLRPTLDRIAPAPALPDGTTETLALENESGENGLPALPPLPMAPMGQAGEGALGLPQLGTADSFEIPVEDNNGMIALPDLPGLPAPSGEGNQEDEEDPVERLRKLIEDRKEETVEILRGWMDDKTEGAR